MISLAELTRVSHAVSSTPARLEKVDLLSEALRQAGPRGVGAAVSFLAGELRQGRIGIGPATLRSAMPTSGAANAELTLSDVDEVFRRIAATSGSGSGARRASLLGELLTRATPDEQSFLIRLALGELRQGAQEGLLVDAIAKASGAGRRSVRRAFQMAGDLPGVAEAAMRGGQSALAAFTIQLFRPVLPMLARTAEDVDDALARLENPAFEWKLDGARVQVHRAGSDVRVFSRRLNDVTVAVPEVVEAARSLPIQEFILDGEALALKPDGRPHPFQVTMRRFGRKLDVDRMRESLPLSIQFFDCLYVDGESLIDEPARVRLEALAHTTPKGLRVARLESADPVKAQAFFDAALRAGHEGLVAKAIDAPYTAGSRGAGWLKIKPSHSLDLVVLAAEWGHGRRKGWLSNLHLGARDPEQGGFVMLGKTFKGLTDELLAWQTEALQAIERSRDGHTVYVEPQLVVEIVFDGVQRSPRYPGGVTLRFARVKAYRPDKIPEQADTIESVRAILEQGASPDRRATS